MSCSNIGTAQRALLPLLRAAAGVLVVMALASCVVGVSSVERGGNLLDHIHRANRIGHARGVSDAAGGEAATTCVAAPHWYTARNAVVHPASPRDVVLYATSRDVVLLGERHTDADHHRWQLHTLAAMHLMRPNMVIGFEAFPRRVQPVLDQWIAGELSEHELLARVDWKSIWSYPPAVYLPLFHFARMHRLPMIALNVERTLTRAVATAGWDGVAADEREGVTRPAPPARAYTEYLFEVYKHHAQGARDMADRGFQRFVEAQTTWDRAMAQALAAPLTTAIGPPFTHAGANRPLVVGIVGAGHVRYGHGIPHQLRDLGIAQVATLLPVESQATCNEVGVGIADAVFLLPPDTTTSAP
jgi:uncharacterized iron-regulated protein